MQFSSVSVQVSTFSTFHTRFFHFQNFHGSQIPLLTSHPQILSLIPILPILALAFATPAAPKKALYVSIEVFEDTSCEIFSVRGYSFTENNVCRQLIEAEGSITASAASLRDHEV